MTDDRQRLVDEATAILDDHRIMAIATLRPDGWPQNTLVGFANEGIDIYFLISPASQKYRNIKADGRVALAIGREPSQLAEAKAVYVGARADELIKAAERNKGWQLLNDRHPNLMDYQLPEGGQAAIFRATVHHLSVVDYSQGLGHIENQSLTDNSSPPSQKKVG